MAQRYAIANWLTAAQKARAVQGRYTRQGTTLRTRRGYCPLGRALWHPLRVPNTHEVATVPGRQHGCDHWDAILAAAGAFMFAWDHDRLAPADLPTALGYAPGAPPPEAEA